MCLPIWGGYFLPCQKRKVGPAFSTHSVNLPLPYLLLMCLIWQKVTHIPGIGIYISHYCGFESYFSLICVLPKYANGGITNFTTHFISWTSICYNLMYPFLTFHSLYQACPLSKCSASETYFILINLFETVSHLLSRLPLSSQHSEAAEM